MSEENKTVVKEEKLDDRIRKLVAKKYPKGFLVLGVQEDDKVSFLFSNADYRFIWALLSHGNNITVNALINDLQKAHEGNKILEEVSKDSQ